MDVALLAQRQHLVNAAVIEVSMEVHERDLRLVLKEGGGESWSAKAR
jgi:hypothetical protein